jgi:hypothetical protein
MFHILFLVDVGNPKLQNRGNVKLRSAAVLDEAEAIRLRPFWTPVLRYRVAEITSARFTVSQAWRIGEAGSFGMR